MRAADIAEAIANPKLPTATAAVLHSLETLGEADDHLAHRGGIGGRPSSRRLNLHAGMVAAADDAKLKKRVRIASAGDCTWMCVQTALILVGAMVEIHGRHGRCRKGGAG